MPPKCLSNAIQSRVAAGSLISRESSRLPPLPSFYPLRASRVLATIKHGTTVEGGAALSGNLERLKWLFVFSFCPLLFPCRAAGEVRLGRASGLESQEALGAPRTGASERAV